MPKRPTVQEWLDIDVGILETMVIIRWSKDSRSGEEKAGDVIIYIFIYYNCIYYNTVLIIVCLVTAYEVLCMAYNVILTFKVICIVTVHFFMTGSIILTINNN